MEVLYRFRSVRVIEVTKTRLDSVVVDRGPNDL